MAINVEKLIVDALMELCNSKPLSKITVSDISKTSGVSRTTFYKHFQDVYDASFLHIRRKNHRELY